MTYSDDPDWADVAPFPQDDGGPNPLAAINYTEGYAEAMSYLRAVMAADEMSPRALELTEDIISMNTAHYTVWLYRARLLTALSADLRSEVAWLNATALRHPKNYQIWHHRQYLLDRLGDPTGEVAFVNRMLRGDAKNYHVWSYRQWLVRRFGLWDVPAENGRAEMGREEAAERADGGGEEGGDDDGDEAPELVGLESGSGGGSEDTTGLPLAERTTELEETEVFIAQDVRNNSAWNHRFFIVNGREDGGGGVRDPAVLEREKHFAMQAVRKAPQNQSPWSYLRGSVERAQGPAGLRDLEDFCNEFVDLDGTEKVTSSHALGLLAEIWAAKREDRDARMAYDLLAGKYDPIRTNYWRYLSSRLDRPEAVAA